MVKGHFWFKQTSNGNLVGEYCNDHIDRTHTESADAVIVGNSDFKGKYKSSWFENGVHRADLEIVLKPTSSQIYLLEWSDKACIKFKGQGTVVDNVLIGHYESC